MQPEKGTKPNLSVIAIIPARGGSGRVPHKNLHGIVGYPLIAYSILHARRSRFVSEVYVSTEDDEIAAVSKSFGATVIRRPTHLASDTASSESALLHVLDERNRQGHKDPDLVVFLQATSPVRKPLDIDRAVETLLSQDAESLFSACDNKWLIWSMQNSQPCSITYDYRQRKREQEMTKQFRENGSIYVFKPEILRRFNNRLGGRMCVYEMDYWSSFQFDEPEHAELLQWVLQKPQYSAVPEWPDPIRLVIFDFDGVMTDNTVVVAQDGKESVICNRGDGWGLRRLQEAGVPLLVLSTEQNPVVAARCEKLKLPVQQGVQSKAKFLSAYLLEKGIPPAHVVYLGNDENDAGCFKLVGMPVVVSDAHASVQPLARFVLSKAGGRGAVRELCDRILAHLSATGIR